MDQFVLIDTNDKRIKVVDYLKGFSIITIVLMHFIQGYLSALPSGIRNVFSIGGTGGHVFFVCSGFGLYFSYLNHKFSFPEFMKRRFGKIYIPYIIVVIISFLMPWMYSGADRMTALLSHIFLFKMFVPQYEESFGPQLWFISTIIQFYFLFIPLCKIRKKIGNMSVFFMVTFFTSVFWWILVYLLGKGNIRVWGSFCLQYLWEFSLGMCLAEFLAGASNIRESKAAWFTICGNRIVIKNTYLFFTAVIGLSLQAIMAFLSEKLRLFNDIPALLGYSSLALLLFRIPLVEKTSIWVSKFSYELYLVHMLAVMTVFHFINADSLPQQVFCVGISIVFSLAIAFVWKYKFSYFVVN